jgi:hypothetical protein
MSDELIGSLSLPFGGKKDTIFLIDWMVTGSKLKVCPV